MKYLVIYGTRPEAIKMAPLVFALKAAGIDTKVCVTAQHRQMLDQVNDFFGIVPDFDLDIMLSGQSLNALAGKLFTRLDEVFVGEHFDGVFVHGDTTTSAVAAWAAFHRGIRVAHIEAGLRTYNRKSPFPEELNRQLTGRLADMHFAPTKEAEKNLLAEGIRPSQVLVTGNTVIDALFLGLHKIDNGYSNAAMERLTASIDPSKRMVLVTGHRRENFGDGFEAICEALRQIAAVPNVQIIYPVHLNPQVQEPVNRLLSGLPNVVLLEPLDYPAFLQAMRSAYLILTDSGGVQEEAPSLGKPVLVMRNNTERPEAVNAGTVKLVGTNSKYIIDTVIQLLNNREQYELMSNAHNPYGDGNACDRIARAILDGFL